MNEVLEDSLEELRGSLRRAEHTYYVSLKYTRTVDVIRTLIERYVTTLSNGIEVLIEYLHEKEGVERPDALIQRINLVKERFKDETLDAAMDYLLFLRRVLRADFDSFEEFRRHVTMRVELDGNEYEFNIDVLGEQYEEVKAYAEHMRGLVEGVKAE